MMIPSAARRALRRHVDRAVARLDPARYHQEPAYVAALLAKLDDVVYDGKTLKIEIKSTVVDDRGPGSAESIFVTLLEACAGAGVELKNKDLSLRPPID